MTYTCVTWAPRLFNNKSLMTQVNRPGDVALLIASGDRHLNMCCTNSSHSPQLHLKKAALLEALRHKSLDHWLALQIDHSVRQSFEPRQIIIERSLNTIFRQCDQSINDLTKPMDTRNETYKLNIASNDIIPLNPNKHIIITYTRWQLNGVQCCNLFRFWQLANRKLYSFIREYSFSVRSTCPT